MKRLVSISSTSLWRVLRRRFSKEVPVRHWYPTRFLNPAETESNFAVLLLNCRPITDEEDRKYISILWPKARIRACADGGANKLAALNKDQGTAFYPDHLRRFGFRSQREYGFFPATWRCFIQGHKSECDGLYEKCTNSGEADKR